MLFKSKILTIVFAQDFLIFAKFGQTGTVDR